MIFGGRCLATLRGARFERDYLNGLARFDLSEDGAGRSELQMRHIDVACDEGNAMHVGWLNQLFSQNASLTIGVDLRNQDALRSWGHGC
jgi:hypothetical protein